LNKDILEKIYLKVLDYASYKPRSEREVLTKINYILKKFKVTDAKEALEISNTILERFREIELISDSNVKAYVDSFVNSSKPRSPQNIKQYLMRKGFDFKKIESELAKVPAETWINFALSEANKKVKSFKDPKTVKAKLNSFLYSKGYNQYTIGIAVDTLMGVK
jgi:SOS response regulatory protein OraA/RecX